MPLFLSKQAMSDLMVTAWEGGSSYWVDQADYIPPKGMTQKELRKKAWDAAPADQKEFWKDEGPAGRWPLYSFLPFLPPSVKWKVKFTSEVEPAYLTPENMRGAIATLFKNEYAHVAARIKDENYDAGDADAWLQAAIFGKVIFG